MTRYKVEIHTKTHGMLRAIIEARNPAEARSLAQEQYPDAHIGTVTLAD